MTRPGECGRGLHRPERPDGSCACGLVTHHPVPPPQVALTTGQLLQGIGRALEARDMPAVADLLRVLAMQSPGDAQFVLDALAVAERLNP